jgi:hypothetical protein
MAIYRGRRRLLGWRAAVLAAVGAALVGVVVWTASRKPEPTGTARPDPIQALVGVLEIIPVSYEGAVQNGRVIQGQEVQYRGAQDALRRARALFGEAQGTITARNPATARLLEETLRQIEEAVSAVGARAEVR